ncbi:hypothetical protein C8R44DRAFT_751102 [Mycena epipterygia]|nr:hypothetical protein C8R44DRAFT_751102 [Mycena epipterygia]
MSVHGTWIQSTTYNHIPSSLLPQSPLCTSIFLPPLPRDDVLTSANRLKMLPFFFIFGLLVGKPRLQVDGRTSSALRRETTRTLNTRCTSNFKWMGHDPFPHTAPHSDVDIDYTKPIAQIGVFEFPRTRVYTARKMESWPAAREHMLHIQNSTIWGPAN